MYDPEHDLYELLSVSSDATEAELSDQIARLRGTISAVELDEAAETLLNLHTRTRYNAHRATHRMRLLMRASLSVLSGRTPAEGVPVAWSLRSDRPPRPPAPSPVSEDVGADALTVLVVEDDADTRDTIGSVLEESGYRVTAAENGRQALGCLAGGPAPACMVLDLMMPIMDGWSLVAEMRLGGLPAVPILVVTAADSSAYPVPFRQVLRKPINPERLLTLVAELVRIARAAALGRGDARLGREPDFLPGHAAATNVGVMDKRFLVEQLTERLRESAAVARKAGQAAAEEAREGATPGEKREDARVALEQGSLARGQASRAAKMAAELSALEIFRPAPLSPRGPVALGAVVEVEDEAQGKTFFLAPVGAGIELVGPGGDGFLSVVTPQSPVGKAVLGRRVGETIEVMVQGEPREWTITFVG